MEWRAGMNVQNRQISHPVAMAQTEARLPGEMVDFTGLFNTLWRGRLGILLGAVLAIALSGLWLISLAKPSYRATAVVILQTGAEPVVDFGGVLPGLAGDSSVVNTEVEVLRSRSLMARVAGALDLKSDPEFNPALRVPGITTGFVGRFDPPLPVWLLAAETPANAVVEELRRKVIVRNIPDSLVFEIVVETGNPAKSVRIANTLAELYILGQIETKYAATEQATNWLSDRVLGLKSELEEAEARTKFFAAQSDLVSEEALLALGRQLKDLRARLVDTRGSIASRAKLSTGREQVELARLTARLTALVAAEGELDSRIARQSADLVTLEQMVREADASRQIYEYFLARLKETSVQQGVQKADSRLLSAAVFPDRPAAPRPRLVLLMSAALGLVLGASVVLGREARQSTYRTVDALERDTGLPVLGQLPRIPARKRQGVLGYLLQNPSSAASEAVRNLRTALLMADGEGPKLVVLTSSLPGEGKTTLALALAQSTAVMGKRVLLVEGDIRRRVFGAYFDLSGETGLAELIKGTAELREVLQRDKRFGFDVLIGGASTENAADLFSGEPFARFLRQMRARYDLVVIDTPPVLAVPDALVIGRQADAILYTVRWDVTRRASLHAGLRLLGNVGLKARGLVLGQVDLKAAQKYGPGDGYGGDYGYG
jgi:polysaccharide biosynthesis transport protein